MPDPFLLTSTALTQSSDTPDQIVQRSQQSVQHNQAVAAEKERLNQILLRLRKNVRPDSGTASSEFPQSTTTQPTSGSQLYAQRLAALRSGQLYTQLPANDLHPLGMTASQPPTYEQWRQLLTQEAAAVARNPGNQPLGVLLGDSLSLWFPSDRLPQTQRWLNQSISGETTRHILQRLSDFSQIQPRVIYIMAGINDLKNGASDAQVLWNLRQIIDQLQQTHPQAQIVMQSILPTRAVGFSNPRIVRLNQQLRAIAQHNGAYYLDVYSPMADASGNLRPDLTTDGLHLNAKGYQTWQAVLQQAELQMARGG